MPFSNHFDYRHVIDDHNNLRHQLPAIEQVWTTHRWATRVFSFILAVVEVNCYLAFRYFIWNKEEKQTLSEFWSDLAWALIDNDFIDEEIETISPAKQRRRQVEHKLVSAPVKAKKWDGCKWIKSSKQRYPQQ